ncbi:MAG: DNA polymerase III subunit delta [Burkholderiales bacterium]|nr:DNA polymerase III subunit delta [Burkholderiales bacterium]
MSSNSLDPLTVIVGEEPFLAIEAQDNIRAKAFKQGFTERCSFQFDGTSNWTPFLEALSTVSLFGEKKIIELRLPTGQPGNRAGPKALQQLAKAVGDDLIAVVSLPGTPWEYAKKDWYKTLTSRGRLIVASPIPRQDYPAWVADRAAKNGQKLSPDALDCIVASTEGNLLACSQELSKLALTCPKDTIELEDVLQSMSDVSRYSPQDLADAILQGDGPRVSKIIDGLEAENTALPSFLWLLNDDLRNLIYRKNGIVIKARGGIQRASLLAKAARALPVSRLETVAHRYAELERMSKGAYTPERSGNEWQELKGAALYLCIRRN